MENPYYKYLKLSSGDNIICTTTDDCEDIYDRKSIKVTQPVILSAIRMPSSRGIVESYIMYPLFTFTEEEEYVIPTSQIVLAINIKENLKNNYLTYLSQREEEDDELVADDEDELEDEEETIDEFLNRLGDEINEDKETQEYGEGILVGRVGRNPKRLFELSEIAKDKSNIALDKGKFRKSDRLNRKANRLENKAIAKK